MPLSFIRSFVENELILNEEEFSELKESQYFQDIIEQSLDTKLYGLQEKVGVPQ